MSTHLNLKYFPNQHLHFCGESSQFLSAQNTEDKPNKTNKMMTFRNKGLGWPSLSPPTPFLPSVLPGNYFSLLVTGGVLAPRATTVLYYTVRLTPAPLRTF